MRRWGLREAIGNKEELLYELVDVSRGVVYVRTLTETHQAFKG